MSLLKWQELAKNKSKLGNKINFVRDTITERNLGEKVSETSFKKAFKPITSKLNDVMISNLQKPIKRKPVKKGEVPDYGISIDDELEDFDLDNLYADDIGQTTKEIVPKPPSYEDSLQDLIEGKKQIYMNPDLDLPEEPPIYDYDEGPDYGIMSEDEEEDDDEEVDDENSLLDELDLPNYDSVQKQLDDTTMNQTKTTKYLKKIIRNASYKQNQLKASKANITKAYKKGQISETEKNLKHEQLNSAFVALKNYISFYDNQLKTKKGSGIKNKKGGGGNIIFFNNPKQLIKKLEIIIGSMMAGNTSKEIRDTGVAISDMLLKTSSINKAQHETLYKKYFKI